MPSTHVEDATIEPPYIAQVQARLADFPKPLSCTGVTIKVKYDATHKSASFIFKGGTAEARAYLVGVFAAPCIHLGQFKYPSAGSVALSEYGDSAQIHFAKAIDAITTVNFYTADLAKRIAMPGRAAGVA